MILQPKSQLWQHEIQKFWNSEVRRKLSRFLQDRHDAGAKIIPHPIHMMEAFDYCGPQSVRVVIIGQDPYPDEELATGLAFSVPIYLDKPPASLKNIFRALKIDIGVNNEVPSLRHWAYQGVLLLNSVLSTEHGKSGAHFNKGWEKLTDLVVKRLGDGDMPRVFMLWGKKAQAKKKLITGKNKLILEASHPSPQSASQGFIWSKPFSKANEFLLEHGYQPIDWTT